METWRLEYSNPQLEKLKRKLGVEWARGDLKALKEFSKTLTTETIEERIEEFMKKFRFIINGKIIEVSHR